MFRGYANLCDWKTLEVHAQNASFWSHQKNTNEALYCQPTQFSCESLELFSLKASAIENKIK